MDTTVADPLVGELLDGRYRVLGRIARGGMATVYRATDERLERTVAVKVVHPTYAGSPRFLERFDREAKTIAGLTHPNVVSVFDSGRHGDLPYLVMEHVPGRTLRDRLSERGRLPPAEAVAIMNATLAALAASHRSGLVHRDVKPENILLAEPEPSAPGHHAPVVKVADFGLARAMDAGTEENTGGQLMATVAYVPPELIQHGRADPRSDVYSAGIVLFEMLTGDVPYHGKQAVDVAFQHVEHDVPNPSRFIAELPPVLDELVVRATRRDPGARPADAGAFLAELQAAASDAGLAPGSTPVRPTPRQVRVDEQHTVPVPGPPPPHRRHAPRVTPRRRKALIAAGVVLALGLAAGIGGWWLGAGRYTTAPSMLTQDRAAATQRARQAGLSVRWAAPKYSETAPKGTVMAQDPKPGGQVVRGGVVTLTPSAGPERYTVPSLIGIDSSAAADQLRGMHLKTSTSRQYSSTVGRDKVIGSSPAAGTVLRRGDAVTLTVSNGPAPVTVPDEQGKDVAAATSDLTAKHLKVSTTTVQNTVKKGTVLAQSPPAGTGVEKDTTVTLTVSAGPPQQSVPSVVGLKLSEARKKLTDAGFTVQASGLVSEDATVYSQNPGGGGQAPAGSTVTVLVL